MKNSNLLVDAQQRLLTILKEYMPVLAIVQIVHERGGRALLVGGAVRDLLLGLPLKDLDIEIYGLTVDELEAILRQFGHVRLVGKVYGVLCFDGLAVDWSLPRTDAAGRKPQVNVDPHMLLEQAFRRRDLTINAMGIDLVTFELIDPFNGQDDLAKKILRAPDATTFAEDPLRFFRVMQFVGRFSMMPDATLQEICKTISLEGVSRERIAGEFEKLLLLSHRPSLGIRWLRDVGRLEEILPELAATIGVQQNPAWHPEGDVFEHTMQTIDAAARFTYKDDNEKLLLLLTALCHDLGKPAVTKLVDGIWRSRGHEEEGIEPARSFLKRITLKKDLIDNVLVLVRHHRAPGVFVKEGAKPAAYKRLARALAPLSIELLARLTLADKQGRNNLSHEPLTNTFEDLDEFVRRAQAAGVNQQPEKPLLVGADLAPYVEPGPRMGELLKKAYQLQIEESIIDKTELLNKIVKNS
jgi:tRNA nucleotidyltransferase (CCA-adding enzyme)